MSRIKSSDKNKNRIEITNSFSLALPGGEARDLASTYENWLGNRSIPEVALNQEKNTTKRSITRKQTRGKKITQ